MKMTNERDAFAKGLITNPANYPRLNVGHQLAYGRKYGYHTPIG